MRPKPHHFSQPRVSEWRTRPVADVSAPKYRIGGRGEEVVDIRAIDHVNGRFVTCEIIQASSQDSSQDECAISTTHQHPQLSQPTVNQSDIHNTRPTIRYNNRRGSDFEPMKERNLSFFTEDTKLGCLLSRNKQRALLILLIVLFIVIVTATSLITSPYSKFG